MFVDRVHTQEQGMDCQHAWRAEKVSIKRTPDGRRACPALVEKQLWVMGQHQLKIAYDCK